MSEKSSRGRAGREEKLPRLKPPSMKHPCKLIREMGGAPMNPAPRNHFLVWIVKPSGCHCTDGHSTSRVSCRILKKFDEFIKDFKGFLRISEFRRVPTPLQSISPFSETGRAAEHMCTYIYIYIYICICICICAPIKPAPRRSPSSRPSSSRSSWPRTCSPAT